MSMGNGVEQMDGEQALHDVLHIVCEYLKFKDLFSVAQVCKSWWFAAKQESNRRIGIQQFYLPFELDDLDRKLYVYPKASLLVYDSKLETSPLPLCFPDFDCDRRILAREMLEKFKCQLPNKLIVLGVEEHVTTFVADHVEVHPDAPTICDWEQSGKPNILGIFFPSMERRIRVHVASQCLMPNWPPGNPIRTESINRLAGELGLYELCDPYPKSTIIQFAVIGGRDHTLIGELGKRAQENGKEITWTSIFGGKLRAEDSSVELRRPSWTTTAFIRISGPEVESWNTFIDLCSDRDRIQKKLDELNAKVKRKRNNLGFIYAPTCGMDGCSHEDHPCGDSLELVLSLNRVFPDIRFTGFFVNFDVYTRMNAGRRRRFFADRFDENDARNFNKDFLHRLPFFVSIIVISYD